MRAGALLTAALLAAFALLVGCGEEDQPDEEPGRPDVAEIGEILADPGAVDGWVRLRGMGTPLGEEGFAIDDGTGTIVVLAADPPANKVEREELAVAGRVKRLDDFQVEWLRESAVEANMLAAFEEISPTAGDPYIELLSLSGEGNS